MNETLKRFMPVGWHTVTPRIVVNDAAGLTEFLKHVFKASGDYRTDRPSVITIGDSMLMVGETGAREVRTAFLYVYVSDVDAAYQRALDAAARTIERVFTCRPTSDPQSKTRPTPSDQVEHHEHPSL